MPGTFFRSFLNGCGAETVGEGNGFELASAMEVSRQTIGSLENGRYNPSILLAFKLARYFGVSIEEIFICEEENHEEE